jgi:hypothetical protein
MVRVPLITPGLSLTEVAERLRDTGYTVAQVGSHDDDSPVLVVAKKE